MAANFESVQISEITNLACDYIGVEWADLTTAQQQKIIRFLNNRYYQASISFDWPVVDEIEKRYWQTGAWVAGGYNANDITYHEATEKYYQNTSGGATFGVPGTSSDWTEVSNSDFTHSIIFDQSGYDPNRTKIQRVLDVYLKDPDITLEPEGIRFDLRPDRIIVNEYSGDYVWIRFTSPLTSHVYSNLTTTVPLYFKPYLAEGVYADWLRGDRQNSKFAFHNSLARELLTLAYDDIKKRQEQSVHDKTQMRQRTRRTR